MPHCRVAYLKTYAAGWLYDVHHNQVPRTLGETECCLHCWRAPDMHSDVTANQKPFPSHVTFSPL